MDQKYDRIDVKIDKQLSKMNQKWSKTGLKCSKKDQIRSKIVQKYSKMDLKTLQFGEMEIFGSLKANFSTFRGTCQVIGVTEESQSCKTLLTSPCITSIARFGTKTGNFAAPGMY